LRRDFIEAVRAKRIARLRELPSVLPFVVTVTWAGGWCRLALGGELDLATAPALELELDGVEKRGPGLLILDLRRLSFMDLAGLRVLLAAQQRAYDQRNRLVIVQGPRAVQRVFELAGVEPLINLIDDPAAAGHHRLLMRS
jgi:anti-sigma B factor antagonist